MRPVMHDLHVCRHVLIIHISVEHVGCILIPLWNMHQEFHHPSVHHAAAYLCSVYHISVGHVHHLVGIHISVEHVVRN